MSQNQEPPSFLDHPGFQDEFSQLDRGLGEPDRKDLTDPSFRPGFSAFDQGLEGPDLTDRPTRDGPVNQVPAESPGAITPIFPESALAPGPPSPPLSTAIPGPSEPAPQGAPHAGAAGAEGPRPLLELFPPTLARERVRSPAPGGASPPRTVRSRFAPEADSVPLSSAALLTYERFYGLSENPFSLAPAGKFLYHSSAHDRVLQELIDALGRGDAVMLLTGESGIGKTTLCRSLVEQVGPRTVTSLIADQAGSFEDLLRTVLVDFGVVTRDDANRGQLAAATRQELIAALGDFAASLAPLRASAVIVIDQAQDLPAEHLDALSALNRPDPAAPEAPAGADRRVQIVLAGRPSLLPLLHRGELRPLERQVAVRCRLEPLTAEEVTGYVVHRIAIAGAHARVEFDEGALAELHVVTRGVPRLVNMVCDRALTRGQQMSASVIDEEFVAMAAADLDLVPLRSETRWFTGLAVRAVVLLALMLTGAAGAAWLFRVQVSQILGR